MWQFFINTSNFKVVTIVMSLCNVFILGLNDFLKSYNKESRLAKVLNVFPVGLVVVILGSILFTYYLKLNDSGLAIVAYIPP